MGSTKSESISIVEEIPSTERIGSLDDETEVGMANSGLGACTRHCPTKSLKNDHYHCDSSSRLRHFQTQNQIQSRRRTRCQ